MDDEKLPFLANLKRLTETVRQNDSSMVLTAVAAALHRDLHNYLEEVLADDNDT